MFYSLARKRSTSTIGGKSQIPAKAKKILLVGTTQSLLNQITKQVDPAAWYNGISGRANSTELIIIRLKDPSQLPN